MSITYNYRTGIITATTFTGAVTGNADTATTATGATNIDINATTSTDTTTFPVLVGAASTGNQLPFIDNVNFSYNASTNALTATTFIGALTGNASTATTAATVTTAAQPTITSVGTLTSLQVDSININASTISSTAGTDLFITPLGGEQLILDGLIIIDNGSMIGITTLGFDGVSFTGVDTAGQFTDDDVTMMTSAAVNDRIESFGYSTTTGTVTSSGSPLVNEVAVFTTGTDIDSDSTFTWNGTTLFATNVTGTNIGGITQANLVDLAATETITGIWNLQHGTRISDNSGSAQLFFEDAGSTTKWQIGVSGAATDDFIIFDTDNSTRLQIDDTTGDVSILQGLLTAASSTSRASINIPTGTAPSSPAQGDMWVTASDALIRINGVSESMIGSGGVPTQITVADSTDSTSFPAFFESATGDLGPKTDASNYTYNATTGVLTTGGLFMPDSDVITFGTGSDATIGFNGTIWQFQGVPVHTENNLLVRNGSIFAIYDSGNNDNVNFTHNGTDLVVAETGTGAVLFSSINLRLTDNDQLQLGSLAGGDAQLYFDGADVFLDIAGSAPEFRLRVQDTELAIVAIPNAAVQLYYNNNLMAATKTRLAADDISGLEITNFDGNQVDAGFATMEAIIKTSALTIAQTHIHKTIRITNTTGNITFTNSTSIPFDCVGWIINETTSNQTLAATSNNLEVFSGDGVANATGDMTLAGKGWCTWRKRSDALIQLVGVGLS